MKARVGNFEVEGTIEEIAALYRALGLGDSSAGHTVSRFSDGKRYVGEDFAFRVLKRRSLSPQAAAVFRTLRVNYPSWTTATDLQIVTGYNANQLGGLFGALGKRAAATEGHDENLWLFEQEWDYDNDCYRYRLPDGLRAAVARAGL